MQSLIKKALEQRDGILNPIVIDAFAYFRLLKTIANASLRPAQYILLTKTLRQNLIRRKSAIRSSKSVEFLRKRKRIGKNEARTGATKGRKQEENDLIKITQQSNFKKLNR